MNGRCLNGNVRYKDETQERVMGLRVGAKVRGCFRSCSFGCIVSEGSNNVLVGLTVRVV